MKIETRNFLYESKLKDFETNLATMIRIKSNSNIVMSDSESFYSEHAILFDYYFHPNDVNSCHYNPLDFVRMDDTINDDKVMDICDAIVNRDRYVDPVYDPLFEATQRALLACLIYYVLENDEIDVKSLGTVYKLLQNFHDASGLSLDEKYANSKTKKALENWYSDRDDKGKFYFERFSLVPVRTAVDIIINLMTDKMSVYSDSKFRELTDTTSFTFDTFRRNANAFFVSTGKKEYNFLYSILYKQFVDYSRYSGLHEIGRNHICFNLNMSQLRLLPEFDTMLSIGNGGYNISHNIYVESRDVISQSLGDKYGIVIANCFEV